MTGTDERRVFVIAHTGRQDARDVAGRFCRALAQHGLPVRLLEDEAAELDLDLRASAVASVVAAAARRGWGTVAVTTSPLPGPSGNVEYFIWLRQGPGTVDADQIAAEVRRTAALGVPGEKVDP